MLRYFEHDWYFDGCALMWLEMVVLVGCSSKVLKRNLREEFMLSLIYILLDIVPSFASSSLDLHSTSDMQGRRDILGHGVPFSLVHSNQQPVLPSLSQFRSALAHVLSVHLKTYQHSATCLRMLTS